MPATEITYNLKPVINDGVFNRSPIKQLAYKPVQLLDKRNNAVQKKTKLRAEFSSMGFIIPFQPCMWNDKTVDDALTNTIKLVKNKMKENRTTECTDKTIARLQKIFTKLNFNTHCKSLAVTLTPDEEKVFYLSFPVRPVVFFSKSVSLLDLAANMKLEPDFYYLVLNKGIVSLYDYNNNHLVKVYEQNNETCSVNLFKNAAAVIELLSSKNEKLVFVTGSPNLVEQFCNSEYYAETYFPLLYHKAPFSREIIQSLVNEIICHWNYWRSKYIKGRVLLTQKLNGLISNTEAVLLALRRGADGLLLMDKRLKHQLQKAKPGNFIFQIADELISLIEKFLARGNRFEITETGLLKNLGGIVLLPNNKPGSGVHKLHNIDAGTRGSLF